MELTHVEQSREEKREINATELIRFSGHEFLSEFRVRNIDKFEATFNGVCCSVEDTSGGFGLPHVIAYCDNPAGYRKPKIELGLIESEDSDDYIQDGSDPLRVNGWAWRMQSDDELVSGGWSDQLYHTAQEAFEAAIKTND